MTEDEADREFLPTDRLPSGWESLPLKQLMVADKTSIKRGPFGSAIKKSFFVSKGYKVYEQKNAIYDDATLGNYFINAEKFDELRDFEVKPGDFIVSCSGTIGRISRLPPNAQPGVINQALLKLTIDEERVHPKYFLYLFRSHRLQQLVLKDTRGSAMKNLASVDDLKEIRLPLPPIKQQETIVAEIEKQFSRLDEAVANLKRVKANLKRYKVAVLKAAIEGKLTEEWRKRHPDIEPASELLKRILAERRAKWNGKGKYKEPNAPDTTGLPSPPEGWTWAGLDQILLNITDGDHQPPPQTDSGVPFLVIGNVRTGKLDFEDTRFVPRVYAAAVEPFRKPTHGDILYSLVGSYGIALGVNTEREFCIQRHLAVLRPHKQSPTNYLVHVLNSSFAFRQATAAATGTAQKTVPLAGLRRFVIPLPPSEEQERIVAEVERRLSVIEELEAQVAADLQRAEHLRQSILHRAFEGKLLFTVCNGGASQLQRAEQACEDA